MSTSHSKEDMINALEYCVQLLKQEGQTSDNLFELLSSVREINEVITAKRLFDSL